MILRVFSMDIAASTTGWSFISDQLKNQFEYGLIRTKPKFSTSERLVYFRRELENLLLEFRPTHIVIEDVYYGLNVKTTVLLSKFAGVAQECCKSFTGVEPHIIHTNTVKAYFKVKTKQQIFDFIVDIFDWDREKISFKKHNDLTDAIAQLICFCDQILGARKFRIEKEYGFLYEV